MLYLKKLNAEDAEKEYAFFQRFPEENGFMNNYYGIGRDEFISRSIPQRLEYEKGLGLPAGTVPDTYYFLWLDDEIIGNFKLRHYLNDFLRNGSGHIGFGVLREYRGRGYATAGLKMAIEELVSMPDFDGGEIYMSCNKDNPASLRVQLKNGGYIHHEDDEKFYVRIKTDGGEK